VPFEEEAEKPAFVVKYPVAIEVWCGRFPRPLPGGETPNRLFLKKMSQHPSLKVSGAAEAKRTVLTRYERVELLRKRGELKDDDRITGLKKTKPEE
jgi:small basic protein (TIGR04137 family)